MSFVALSFDSNFLIGPAVSGVSEIDPMNFGTLKELKLSTSHINKLPPSFCVRQLRLFLHSETLEYNAEDPLNKPYRSHRFNLVARTGGMGIKSPSYLHFLGNPSFATPQYIMYFQFAVIAATDHLLYYSSSVIR